MVRKDVHLTWPRAETPTHFISMGTDKDFVQAAKIAVREAVQFLMAARGLSKDDAYMLVSVSPTRSASGALVSKGGRPAASRNRPA